MAATLRDPASANTPPTGPGFDRPLTPAPPAPVPLPGAPTASDRLAERALRAQVREEVARMLAERQLLAPRAEDEQRVAAIIRARIERYQRDSANANTPLVHDPV